MQQGWPLHILLQQNSFESPVYNWCLASTIQLNNFYFKLEKYRTHNFEEHVQEIVDKICSWYKCPKLQGHQWSCVIFATK